MNKLMRFVTGFLLLTITLAASCGQEPTLDENENTTPSQTAVPNETANPSENTPLPPPAIATALPTKAPVIAEETTTDDASFIPSPIEGEGALISLEMDSQAGILLDEYPEEMRGEVAAALSAEPDDFWLEMAQRQVALTYNRLHFRPFFYPDKGQLPLPPQSLWHIELTSEPTRQTINNHDLILIGYTSAAPCSPAWMNRPKQNPPWQKWVACGMSRSSCRLIRPSFYSARAMPASTKAASRPTATTRKTSIFFTTTAARQTAAARQAAIAPPCQPSPACKL
ncbi:MAG: hypothetical protein H6656_01415 [Ardenticatenaceae bacterium]|nr:hypothetical protein [Ardenticatenaceae bacterium]